jgi:membrane protein implicated in regulation of membrane protease activity
MPLIEYVDAHQAEFWVFVGFALLALELLVLGLTSGVLLFGAVGALLTGILMMAGVLPENWATGISGFGILAAVSTAVLWRPLMRLQRRNVAPKRDRTSDLIGYEFILSGDIDAATESSTAYSGITWKVRPDPELAEGSMAAGTRVRVSGVDAGIFYVVRATT